MNLLGKATDKSFWESVRCEEYYSPYVKEVLALFEEGGADAPITPLNYNDFRLYRITGDRSAYERVYFRRRAILNASAILSLIYPDNEKYFKKLQEAIFDICNEYTWCLPAHLYLGEENSRTVDLFASETGFYLAEIYRLFEDKLDEFLKGLILSRIEERVINPTINRTEGWVWESFSNNWLAVCFGSMGCTAMLLYPEAFKKLKPRIDKAFESYIESFLGEGICLEGCSYWLYGFGYFTIYADMLKSYTCGKEDYFKRADVKAIATFPQKMLLSGNTVASFSDASRMFENTVGIIHYLKSVYPDDVKLPSSKYCNNGIKNKRFPYILRSATWAKPEYFGLDEIDTSSEYFYGKESQWYINKTPVYSFAAKGGKNNEPHNHNDIGNFIFAKGGVQIFTDIGNGRYDKDYFNENRYNAFEPSSFSHSIPIISGKGQGVGEKYYATDVFADKKTFSLNISTAYDNSNLKSLIRRFDMLDGGIKITDKFIFDSTENIIERFVTLDEPKLIANGVIEVCGAKLLFGDEVESFEINKKVTALHECYIIDLAIRAGVSDISFEIK